MCLAVGSFGHDKVDSHWCRIGFDRDCLWGSCSHKYVEGYSDN